MLSFLHLPLELTERIFLNLNTPQDLLCTALTCKTFHDLIIPTYHLHFIAISCGIQDSQQCSDFWRKLSNSRYLCSRIRQIKLCTNSQFHHTFHGRQFPGFRIDERFLATWLGPYSLAIDTSFTFQNLLQTWNGFTGCQVIVVHEGLSREESSDLIAYITSHLSETLKTLVINPEFYSTHEDPMPRYLASDCTFSCLEVIYFHLELIDDLAASVEVVLNSLVSSCPTLVEFTLRNDWTSEIPYFYPQLFEKANWPSLKKLGLTGPLRLFDPEKEEKQKTDIYISFLERHLQLECLHLESDCSDGDPNIKPFQVQLPPHTLPQLRFLDCGFTIHPDTLSRLFHMTGLQLFSLDTYPLARSLRSCILMMDSAGSRNMFEKIAEAIPQLECLGLYQHQCVGECTPGRCTCILQYDLFQITKLVNLTHLALFADGMDDILADLVSHLSRLSFVYFRGRYQTLSCQYHVIRDRHNAHSYELVRSSRLDYPNSGWVDFFDVFLGNSLLWHHP